MAEQEYDSAADELAALMSGELKLDNEAPDDEVTTNEDTDYTEETDEVDTVETDTEEDHVDDTPDTDDDVDAPDEDEDEENTLVDENSSKDDEDEEPEDEDADEADESDEDTEEKSEDSTDTEQPSDGEAEDTDTIDYKKQYEELLEGNTKLQGFYDEVTSEFTANGKSMKGFTDPKKIIQAQQMAAGFSEKMSGFKPYRPFMSTIKEQGWLEDPAKFDMAVNLMNKDPEAIKQLIKDSGMDVLDMDMETINYTGEQHTASSASIALDDVMASARAGGVEKSMQDMLGGQWSDDGSLVEVLNNPSNAQAIVGHMAEDADGNSAYKDIQARIGEKLRTDYNGSYSNKNSLNQYIDAARELESEFGESQKQGKLNAIREAQNEQASKVEAEKAKIETARTEREYKAKVEKETKKVNSARNKAASLSKPKRKSKAKATKFDPIDDSHGKSGDDLMDYFNKNIMGRSY